ncbi:hypothetical protein V5O48_014722 [Marasmius crinis-equi]|uniref:Transmembrane protein n=1 Tax=Marasmius crinis-equi TaxID=585013 RepID=A0ABR3EWH0_9AGAR
MFTPRLWRYVVLSLRARPYLLASLPLFFSGIVGGTLNFVAGILVPGANGTAATVCRALAFVSVILATSIGFWREYHKSRQSQDLDVEMQNLGGAQNQDEPHGAAAAVATSSADISPSPPPRHRDTDGTQMSPVDLPVVLSRQLDEIPRILPRGYNNPDQTSATYSPEAGPSTAVHQLVHSVSDTLGRHGYETAPGPVVEEPSSPFVGESDNDTDGLFPVVIKNLGPGTVNIQFTGSDTMFRRNRTERQNSL